MISEDELKPSKDWCTQFGHVIMDADGWDRKNYDYSFNQELITSDEYYNRLQMSTILIQRGRSFYPNNEK